MTTMRTISVVNDFEGRPTNQAVMKDRDNGRELIKMITWTPQGAIIIDSEGRETRVAKDGHII